MSYDSGEQNILTTLRKLGPWTKENSSRSNWEVLNSGKSARYVIIRPGPFFENKTMSLGGQFMQTTWTTILEFWRLYDNATSIEKLQKDVDDTIRQIDKFPYLGAASTGNIQKAAVVGGSEIEQRWAEDGGPTWVVWEITIQWDEEKITTPSE